jgi:hypothetical protein
MKGYQSLLAKSDLDKTELDRFAVKLERATNQRAAWDERCQVLVEMVASIEEGVIDVCGSKDRISTSLGRHSTNRQ